MIVAVVQARTSSSRLPGKVLRPILGRPMLAHQLERVARAERVDRVVVATSDDPSDDGIAALAAAAGAGCYRGALDDVLDRVFRAAIEAGAEHVVRLTGDCPLSDPAIIDTVVAAHLEHGADYTSNTLVRTYPDGLDVEVVTIEALAEARSEARAPEEREHVTPFVHGRPRRYALHAVTRTPDLGHLRWVVDYEADFELVREVFTRLVPGFGLDDVLRLRDELPALFAPSDEALRGRYRASLRQLERASRTIPLGAQTYSKSRVQYPPGAAPLYLTRGRGARTWDLDGNEYVDLVCALCAVSLGHCDPDVEAAVVRQLEAGTSFSLSHPLEAEVAEAIVELVPCAEQVRFGKNGSDATTAAIRLARAVTGREHVAVCGYHGWHDWYIGATSRDLGVPEATKALTHRFAYDDAGSLAEVLDRHAVAAVIMEPMNVEAPRAGFLEDVRRLCDAHRALLVFDETITGFRFALGGAQELFGVTPDLATFGKGLANGLPLSVLAGRAELMARMEQVFFSTTFGGETLSLAAARAVLDKLRREPVLATIAAHGRQLADGTRARIDAHGLGDVLRVSGHPSWSFVRFGSAGPYDEHELRTLFVQECAARGVLTLGTHNVCYALDATDVGRVLTAYDEVLAVLREAIDREDLDTRLRCEVLRPLFTVRSAGAPSRRP